MATRNLSAPLLGTGMPGEYSGSDMGTGHDFGIHGAVTLANGKTLTYNYYNLVLRNADGSVDTSFGNAGWLHLFDSITRDGSIDAIAVQRDGKFLVASHEGGYASSGTQFGDPDDTRVVVTRLNPDGSIDSSFGTNGRTVTDIMFADSAQAMHVLADGRFVVGANTGVGASKAVLLRYSADGAPDNTFGDQGKAFGAHGHTMAQDMKVAADGSYYVLGNSTVDSVYSASVTHFLADGTLDKSFGDNGMLFVRRPATVKSETGAYTHVSNVPSFTLQPDGKIIVALDAEGTEDLAAVRDYLVLARYDKNGALDRSFGSNGYVTAQLQSAFPKNDSGWIDTTQLAVAADGKIVAVANINIGNDDAFAVLKFNTDGTPATDFGNHGQVFTEARQLGVQVVQDLALSSDGSITIFGEGANVHHVFGGSGGIDPLIVRLRADGSPDAAWHTGAASNTIQIHQGDAQARLNSAMAVYDRDNMAAGRGNYAGASLVLEREGGANPDDVFYGAGWLHFSNGRALIRESNKTVDIGSVQHSGGQLTIRFNEAATGELVNELLQHISYDNQAADAEAIIRIGWTFDDGKHAAHATTTVELTRGVPYWIRSLLNVDAGRTLEEQAAYLRSLLDKEQSIEYQYGVDASHGSYSPAERAFIESYLAKVAESIDVHYVKGDGADDLVLYNFLNPGTNALGQALYPDENGASLWVPLRSSQGDPMWTAERDAGVLLHELGHTLGLKHHFNYDAPGPYLPREEDEVWFTMMVRGGEANTALGLLDTAALQFVYGPSQAARSGNDQYTLQQPSGDRNPYYYMPEVNRNYMIWDGGGNDTISGHLLTHDLTLYLDSGHWSYINERRGLITDPGQITINYGTVIENATGGAGNDTLVGNHAANTLDGAHGHDTLEGAAGNDTLDGGQGFDTARFSGKRGDYTLQALGNGVQVSGADGVDRMQNIERLVFSDGVLDLASNLQGTLGTAYRLYQAAFDRLPDAAGVGFWSGMLAAGVGQAEVAHSFVGSAEFTALYGTQRSPETLVGLLYQHVLHRAPDAAGYAWWVEQMKQGASEASVLLAFSESEENFAQLAGSPAFWGS